MPKPERNEFKEWQEHHVTQFVFEQIEWMIHDYSKGLANGATYDPNSPEKTAMKTAEAVGFIDGLQSLLKIELYDRG